MNTTIKGMQAGGAHISPECRKYHGDKAIEIALEEIRKKYKQMSDKEINEYATYHIIITVER